MVAITIAWMNCYFDDLSTLHLFSLSLDCQAEPMPCQHCSKPDQWVSHGYVYKNQHLGRTQTVGKRIFCSNRSGRSGCGRTIRLYLTSEIAGLHYSAIHLAAFVLALLAGTTIQQAYQRATHTADPRNAYRWLGKLQRKMIQYRGYLNRQPAHPVVGFNARSRQRRILFSTLQALFSTAGESACALFQKHTQTSFV